jgi:hypothetical protein
MSVSVAGIPKNRCRTTVPERMVETRAELPFTGDQVGLFRAQPGRPKQTCNPLRLLTSGRRSGPSRHRTLRATLDWSYDVLSEPERAVLRRLGIFMGGFTLDAVCSVRAICWRRFMSGSPKDLAPPTCKRARNSSTS